MQDGDKECRGTPGFIARHMTVRYFLMVEDLESVEDDKWRSNEMFKHYCASLDSRNDEDKAMQNKKRTKYCHEGHE